MKELELIITPVERDGEQFIVLSPRCHNLAQFEEEIRSAIHKLDEMRQAARANFARWDHEAKTK